MKQLIILFILILIRGISFSQLKSENLKLSLGYDFLFQSKNPIRGTSPDGTEKTFKEFYFRDPQKGDLAYISSGIIQSPSLSIIYRLNKSFEVNYTYKHYFRKFMVYTPYFDDIDSQFEIARLYGSLGVKKIKNGPTLRTSSTQIGFTYIPRLLKIKNINIGVFNSVNFDNYQRSLNVLQDETFYTSEGYYLTNSDTTNYLIQIEESFNTNNSSHNLPFNISFNHSLVLRAQINSSLSIESQIGYRNIRWDVLVPYFNMHVNYKLSYQEQSNSQPNINYKYTEEKKLPFQIGGLFINASIIWNPFFSNK